MENTYNGVLFLLLYEIRKVRVRVGDAGAERISETLMRKDKRDKHPIGVLFYISICNKIIPHTHGSPKTPLPPTVYQLSGMCTPVNFCVRFITAIAVNAKRAFKNIDFKNF